MYTIRFLTVMMTIFSILNFSFASPLDECNDNKKVASFTPLKMENTEDNTFFVIHVNVDSNVDEAQDKEDNTVIKGIEKGINSYISILERLSPNKRK